MKYHLALCALLALMLSGCGENDDKTSSTPEENLTPAQIIQKMEQTGELPVLDRSDEIAGPDVNNNGIRDDIETYIDKEYTRLDQHKAAEQFAVQLQTGLLVDKNDIVAVKQAAYEKARAIGCIYEKFPSGSTPSASTVVDDLIAVSTNTKARLKAHLEFSKALDGTVMSLPEGDVCDE